MIPASQLAGQSRQTTAAPEAPDPYINTLLSGAQKRQATQELEIDASVNSAHGEELDRWFEEQATSVPHARAGQTLPAGSASLDSEAAGVERARRVRALRAPRAHARKNEQQRPRPTGRRRLRSGMRLTRGRILAGTTLTVLAIAAIAIAASGTPGHRPPTRSRRASTSTIFAGLGDTLRSAAAGLQRLETLRARAHQRPSHRTHRAPPRRPIAHPHATTSTARTSSNTPRTTSATDASSAPATSASPSTSTGATAATASGNGSSPAASSSSPARIGPSGPISLIGAGTTPSG